MILTRNAFAKINLRLEIKSARPDGYHEIDTDMSLITLADKITLEISGGEHTHIAAVYKSGKITVPGESFAGDLVSKAAQMYVKASGITRIHSDFEIVKNIPVGAGLGGGSSDAASALLMLNEAYNHTLSRESMMALAGEIGADVPFFVSGFNNAHCTGIGEIVAEIPEKYSSVSVVVVKPDRSNITAEMYREYDKFKDKIPRIQDENIANSFALIPSELNSEVINPIKAALIKSGAFAAEMSGSGSAVFGLFCDASEAEKCAESVKSTLTGIEFCGVYEIVNRVNRNE
ncbi:4-diphosphocytidyl-2C-methyl-D-erythritol kinase [Clostridia bacterium]|nr:4-diphosphocytidyl-2C-methyl-D-erythritol kinase [Clostridia bacterium]